MTKVLVVDDSASQLASHQRVLEANGYHVITAKDGNEGVIMAETEQPDLVLMDVVMPEVNGFQATRKLSRGEKTKDIPVIIVTTKDQPTDRVWAQRQGAKGYLVKPVDETTLLNEVRKFIA